MKGLTFCAVLSSVGIRPRSTIGERDIGAGDVEGEAAAMFVALFDETEDDDEISVAEEGRGFWEANLFDERVGRP